MDTQKPGPPDPFTVTWQAEGRDPIPYIRIKRGYCLVVDEKGVRAELVNAPDTPNQEETSNA